MIDLGVHSAHIELYLANTLFKLMALTQRLNPADAKTVYHEANASGQVTVSGSYLSGRVGATE